MSAWEKRLGALTEAEIAEADRALQKAAADERPLDPRASRSIGALCMKAGSSDVIDGHVALLASHGDLVVSSVLDDLTALLRAARTRATLQRC